KLNFGATEGNRLALLVDSMHQPHYPRDFAAERAGVHHQSAADAARDALAELEALEPAFDCLLDQRAELRGCSRAHSHVVELQMRETLSQVNNESAHTAIADQQISARAEAKRRHALAPRRRHRGAQFVFALDREQNVRRPSDPERGKLGERRAGPKPRAKAGA